MNSVRDEVSKELAQRLEAQRDAASEGEFVDAYLNADGTVVEHVWE